MQMDKVSTSSSTRFLYNNDYINNRIPSINRIANQSNVENERNDETIRIEDVETIVDQMNGFIDPLQTNLKFVLHDELNEYYVTVVDPVTSEVIKEIPPKKMLDMYAAMADFMGILIDEKI
ncbi:flagellar protein FlaG [Virgibacillus sp. W0430]|uniref:flagellar protein FlaG n=1 Tax=Virgibacillus sp. W0430 TaxID=3391580 RepID=UPI003F4891D5